MSLCHCNCLLCLTLLFFVYLFSIFIFYFFPCFLYLFLFFYALLNFLIPPPCFLSSFCFPNFTPSTVSAIFFFSISAVLSHSSGNPKSSQNSGHLLSKRFLTVCLFQFPPLYLWLYFLCFFLFHHKSHFAYHNMVLLCDALIHYYLTIAHFLQVPPSAHHIIYLDTFSATFIHHPVFIFLLEISIDNYQIHPFPKIHNH